MDGLWLRALGCFGRAASREQVTQAYGPDIRRSSTKDQCIMQSADGRCPSLAGLSVVQARPQSSKGCQVGRLEEQAALINLAQDMPVQGKELDALDKTLTEELASRGHGTAGEQGLNETALFMESMMSEMEAKARAVTTLDTALTCEDAQLWATQSVQPAVSKRHDQWLQEPACCDAHERDESNCPMFDRFFAGNLTQGTPSQCLPHRRTAASEPCLEEANSRTGDVCGAGYYGLTALSCEGRLASRLRVEGPPAPCSGTLPSKLSAGCTTEHAPCTSAVPEQGDAAAADSPDSASACPARPQSHFAAAPVSWNGPTAPPLVPASACPGSHSHGSLAVCPATSRPLPGTGPCAAAAPLAAAALCGGRAPGDDGGQDTQVHSQQPTPGLENSGQGPAAVGAAQNGAAEDSFRSAMRMPNGFVVVPSLLRLLADVVDVTCQAPCCVPGGVLTGTWRSCKVAVKLAFYRGTHSSKQQLLAAALANRINHPNLHAVHEVRVARVDEEALAELEPSPLLRPGWGRGKRPVGRLHRFISTHVPPHPHGPGPSELDAGRDSLTVYPGDVLPRSAPPPPAFQALLALRPLPGGVVVATIMEYSEMGNLETLACSPDSPFHASRTWSLHVAQRALLRTAREVAAAMASLHAAGIAHGALHPSNVLLAPSAADRRGFVARVSDVGSSSLAMAASNPLSSGPCMVMLAPEALADGAAVDTPAADVYSFGMLLYLMAAGEMPFHGQHLMPVLMGLASDGLRPKWPEGSHDHLEPLYRRCVAQRPEDRPSFQQVYSEIRALERRVKEEKARRAGQSLASCL